MDMFEPQDHPDDIPYPGGAPTPPYDATGYTLAFTMGVKFDRILEDFNGPFEKLTDFAKVPGRRRSPRRLRPATTSRTRPTTASSSSTGCWPRVRTCRGCRTDRWAAAPSSSPRSRPRGRCCRRRPPTSASSFESAATAPTGTMSHLKKLRIGLFDTYGGGMPSGWTRLILENFEFPYERVYPPDLDKGGLRAKYDVLVFNGSGLQAARWRTRRAWRRRRRCGAGWRCAGRRRRWRPGGRSPVRHRSGGAGRGSRSGGGRGAGGGRAGFTPEPIPEEFAQRQGQVSAQTIAAVKQFVQEGGTVIAIGSAAGGAVQQFGLPATNHLVENEVAAAAREVLRAGRGAARGGRRDEPARAPGSASSSTCSSTTTRSSSSRRTRRRKGCGRSPGSPTRRRSAAAGRGASSTWTRASR